MPTRKKCSIFLFMKAFAYNLLCQTDGFWRLLFTPVGLTLWHTANNTEKVLVSTYLTITYGRWREERNSSVHLQIHQGVRAMRIKTQIKAGDQGCYAKTSTLKGCGRCCDANTVGYAHDNCMESCQLVHGGVAGGGGKGKRYRGGRSS